MSLEEIDLETLWLLVNHTNQNAKFSIELLVGLKTADVDAKLELNIEAAYSEINK